MVMSISNYTGTADTFSWPYNPNVLDTDAVSNHTVLNVPYRAQHVITAGNGVAPKSLILTGHFSGTDKWTNFRFMSKHFHQTIQLKKLFFESDKFYIGIGKQIKKTHSGGRTNFIDYVAGFECIIGLLFGSTEKTSGTNAGNVETFVHEITGTVTSGASDITITDDLGNQITIPASELTTGQAIVYTLVKMVDTGSGIYISEYAYVTIAGTQTKLVQTTDGFGILKIAAGANVSTIVTTNLTSAVVKFRDAYAD